MRLLNRVSALVVILFLIAGNAQADKLCMRKRFKNFRKPAKFLRVQTECPRKYIEILDTDVFKGEDGEDGAQGPAGEDGSIRIYGDASEGTLEITSNQTLTASSFQFENFIVRSGATLTVMSGTVIRCTGQALIQGTIEVQTRASGGYLRTLPTNAAIIPGFQEPASGSARVAGANGYYGTTAALIPSAADGIALNENEARLLLNPGPFGGSGGGASTAGFNGGNGGGTLTILAQSFITLEGGTINAAGAAAFGSGGGGGGGGIVILASQDSVSVMSASLINVSGGDGGNSSTQIGAGGGGGGGIFHALAPSVTVGGGSTVRVSGGTQGDNSTSVTANPRTGGGGGGSMGGKGGIGGSVATDGTAGAAAGGDAGFSLTTETDPTSLF